MDRRRFLLTSLAGALAVATRAVKQLTLNRAFRVMRDAAKIGISAIFLATILAGCAHGKLGPMPAVDSASAAEIVVIRPSGFVGCALPLPITLDGRDIYGLACGEHLLLTVPGGERIIGVKHRTWVVSDENTTAITVARGQRYFLRLDASPFSGPVLNRIAEETGRALVDKTTRLNP